MFGCVLILLFILAVLVGIPFAFVVLRREKASIARVIGPDVCAECRYIIDEATCARGVCPECGAHVRGEGLSTQRSRVDAIDRERGAIVAVGVLSLAPSSFAAMAVLFIYPDRGAWFPSFIVFLLVLVIGFGAGADRVNRRRAEIRRQMIADEAGSIHE